MSEGLLSQIYLYRRLLSRERLMDGHLSPESQGELNSLDGDLREQSEEGSRRKHARMRVQIPATLTIAHHTAEVVINDISGGGLQVTPASLAAPGDRGEVRIVDEEAQEEFVYPVQVRWCYRTKQHSLLGLPFRGAPRRRRL